MSGKTGSYLGKYLETVPLFRNLDSEQLVILSGTGSVKTFNKNYSIFFQSDLGDTFYIVLSGRIKITLLNEDGKEIILSVLKEGDFFGEMSLLDNEIRSASAIVVEEAQLFFMRRSRFLGLITNNSQILIKILEEIGTRLRGADEKIGNLAFLDVYGRTVRLLQQLADSQGRKTKRGIEILNVPTHQEIASMVGATRETVSRIFKMLRTNNTLIYSKDKKVLLRELSSNIL
jgi:CRP/FNR family transcriptional regulator/CRP/FNR family cyclic AMP-dependent transcriptional regulator